MYQPPSRVCSYPFIILPSPLPGFLLSLREPLVRFLSLHISLHLILFYIHGLIPYVLESGFLYSAKLLRSLFHLKKFSLLWYLFISMGLVQCLSMFIWYKLIKSRQLAFLFPYLFFVFLKFY